MVESQLVLADGMCHYLLLNLAFGAKLRISISSFVDNTFGSEKLLKRRVVIRHEAVTAVPFFD